MIGRLLNKAGEWYVSLVGMATYTLEKKGYSKESIADVQHVLLTGDIGYAMKKRKENKEKTQN